MARDNLLNELDLLGCLLDHMSSKSSNGLAIFYGLVLVLCVISSSRLPRLLKWLQFSRSRANEISRAVAVNLTEYGTSTAAKVARGTSITALGLVSGYSVCRTAWCGSIGLCKPVIKRIYQRAQENTLDETDRDDLKSTKFQLLWWTSYLSTSKR